MDPHTQKKALERPPKAFKKPRAALSATARFIRLGRQEEFLPRAFAFKKAKIKGKEDAFHGR